MQKDNEKLITSKNVLLVDDQKLLKERFISEYARKKGWDKTNLSPDQLMEIVQQKGFKNPLLING
jgi:hypothetical protein